MKTITLIVRLLFGLAFVVFGLNGFLDFIPKPKDPPPTHAIEFFTALSVTGYLRVVMALQFIGGLLVLSGRFLPLGLLLLGPIVVNILLYHIFIDRKGLEIAVVTAALALFLFLRHWSAFAPAFRPFSPSKSST